MSEADGGTEPRMGTVLDDAYRLIRPISRGGMGTVYEAIQLKLDRQVAVKIMAGALTDSREALARFRREVKVMCRLVHPHVVQLLDSGTTASNQPYLVTEYLEGEDLQARLDRVERLPLASAVSIVRQVASALAAVHAQAIVHRDLKPANVFLLATADSSDLVKVLDFGISKVTTSTSELTHPASLMGTPEYMSPEQVSGRNDDVDHRSDQWALACMAWHMLAGRPPFSLGPRGGPLNHLLERVVKDEPPSLLSAAPDLPPQLEVVLRRALSKRQTQRFATVTAFLRAFEPAATGRDAVRR